MADSYQKEKQLESSFANFVDPSATSVDILGSIRSLMKFHKDSDKEYEELQKLGKNESKWLLAGVVALNNSPLLQQKLGTGFAAASAVSELLKRREAERIYNDAIDKALDSNELKGNEFGKVARRLINESPLVRRSYR